MPGAATALPMVWSGRDKSSSKPAPEEKGLHTWHARQVSMGESSPCCQPVPWESHWALVYLSDGSLPLSHLPPGASACISIAFVQLSAPSRMPSKEALIRHSARPQGTHFGDFRLSLAFFLPHKFHYFNHFKEDNLVALSP